MAVHGVGITDVDYPVRNDPAYKRQTYILRRCYASSGTDNATYANTVVCEEWKHFSNFKRWFELNCIDGYEIDKDILSDELSIYSPATCLFVPKWLNKFAIIPTSEEPLPVGVSRYTETAFSVTCTDHTNKPKFLGTYETLPDTKNVWLNAKLRYLDTVNHQLGKDLVDKVRKHFTNKVTKRNNLLFDYAV